MSLIIRAKGANFAASTQPKLVPYRYGFPKTSMRALYLCEEGTNGEVHAGSLLDSSGNNNHAPIKAGWTQPTKRAYGFECAAGGLPVLPPISFGAKWTAVIAAAFNASIQSANWYASLLTRAASVQNTPASGLATDQTTGADRTFLNAQVYATTGVASYGIFNASGWPDGAPTNRPLIGGSAAGRVNASSVIGLSYDSTTGLMTARLGSSEVSVTQTGRWNPADAVAFGLLTYVQAYPVEAGAKLHLAGFWSDASADGKDLRDACVDAATKRLAARGLTLLAA